MKQKKQPDGMYSTQSFTDLTSVHSGKQMTNGELVIACGYTHDGRYGYFIIEEQQSVDKKSKRPVWVYTNQRVFIQKKNEQSYKDALHQLKLLTE